MPAISAGRRSNSGVRPSLVVNQEAMNDSGGVISGWGIRWVPYISEMTPPNPCVAEIQ